MVPGKALAWACSSSQSLNQNQPLSPRQVGKLQAGQETRGRGQQCIPACLLVRFLELHFRASCRAS